MHEDDYQTERDEAQARREEREERRRTSWFKREVSVGTLLQIGVMLFLSVGAYFKFDARVTRSEERTALLEARQTQFERSISELSSTSVRLTTLMDSLENPRRRNPN